MVIKARNKVLNISQFLVILKYKLSSQLVNSKAKNRKNILLLGDFKFYY